MIYKYFDLRDEIDPMPIKMECELLTNGDIEYTINGTPVSPNLLYKWLGIDRYFTNSRLEHRVKKVIFNPPATIVFWNDGTKTVSKCEPCDVFDETLGFALCVLKKDYGNASLHKALDKFVYTEDK